MEYKEALGRLSLNPDFIRIIEELRKKRPSIPVYNHKEDNTEDWKYACAMQRGFDLALSTMMMRIDNE